MGSILDHGIMTFFNNPNLRTTVFIVEILEDHRLLLRAIYGSLFYNSKGHHSLAVNLNHAKFEFLLSAAFN